MENRTKKVGITGKYATRYGQKLRKQVKAIEILQRVRSICPFCGKKSIRREAAGIWKCRGCRRAIAGGAWEFVTTAATTAKTTINRLKKNLESRKKPELEREEDEEEVAKVKKQGKKEKGEKGEKGDKKDKKQNKEKEKEKSKKEGKAKGGKKK
jgi:large subunit ribosomal protein L37Ae